MVVWTFDSDSVAPVNGFQLRFFKQMPVLVIILYVSLMSSADIWLSIFSGNIKYYEYHQQQYIFGALERKVVDGFSTTPT